MNNLQTRVASSLAILTPTLRWFLLGMILANIAGSMLFSLLALYMADLGANVTQIGFVFSAASFVPLVLQIFGGWLSDSIGRLRVIAIGSAAACIGYLIMPLAPSWEWVLLGLGFEYISGSMVGPSYSAFVAEQSSPESRGRVFGLSNGLFMIVGVIGPPLAGILVQNLGYRFMLSTAFILYAVATAVRIWMAQKEARLPLPSPEPTDRPTLRGFAGKLKIVTGMLFGGGLLTWILVSDGIRDISSRLSNELQPLYVSEVGGLNVVQIGLIHSLLSLVMMVVTPPAGWLSDKIGENRSIAIGYFFELLGLIGIILASSFIGFASAAVLMGIGYGLINPAFDSLITKAVPEKIRGLTFGFFSSSLGLISLPAPWLGGQLWDRFGPRVPFSLTALAVLFSVWIAYFRFKLPEDRSP
jgi:MFS family permease